MAGSAGSATYQAKRLLKELKEVQSDKALGVTISPVGEELNDLRATFPGPSGSPYEGGTFELSIQVPSNYPFAPPKVKFTNNSQTGMICLDILTPKAWTPVLTLKTTVVSIQSLLTSPEPNDPQDAEVAKHYLSDQPGFESTAKYWTEVYAKPKGSSTSDNKGASDELKLAGLDPAHVAQFVGMGFDRETVVEVLQSLNYRGDNVKKVGEDAVLDKLIARSG